MNHRSAHSKNKRIKEIENKSKQLHQTREEILLLNDSISKISNKLSHQRDKEKDHRIHSGRVSTRTSTLSIDQEKRPSDRDYGVRPYSKMDMDVWRYDQLRGWFNVYSSEPPKYSLTPAQTGYMLKIE